MTTLDYNELVGKVISFTLYASSVLGTGYSRVRLLGVVNATVANTYNDVITQHSQVYSSLPPGIENNYAAYDYLLIQTANGQIVPIGVPWISSPINVNESSLTTVIVPNLNASEIADLSYVLRSNGFTDFTVNTKLIT